jgi:hypothetical protein
VARRQAAPAAVSVDPGPVDLAPVSGRRGRALARRARVALAAHPAVSALVRLAVSAEVHARAVALGDPEALAAGVGLVAPAGAVVRRSAGRREADAAASRSSKHRS